jgi:WD40 repeat protein
VLRGHRNIVLDGAFGPDGRRLVTASVDCTARVWDTVDGTPLGVCRSSARGIAGTAISRDGSLVVMADDDGMLRFWDVEAETRRGLQGSP